MEQVPLFTLDGIDSQKLCRASDFARTHDMPVQTLYSAVREGRIVATRLGGKLYLDHGSAEKFMTTYRKYTTEEK